MDPGISATTRPSRLDRLSPGTCEATREDRLTTRKARVRQHVRGYHQAEPPGKLLELAEINGTLKELEGDLMPLKWWYYLEPGSEAPIRVRSRRQPSLTTVPSCGTWVVQEWAQRQWRMPCLPEIAWGTLRQFRFVGSTIIAEDAK